MITCSNNQPKNIKESEYILNPIDARKWLSKEYAEQEKSADAMGMGTDIFNAIKQGQVVPGLRDVASKVIKDFLILISEQQ